MSKSAVPKLRVAAKAVIINDFGELLIMREAASEIHKTNTQSGRYQLPGGQLEPGETFEHGLRREIIEETGLEIEAGEPLLVGEWRPTVNGELRQIIGVFVAAKSKTSKVIISDEHDGYLWIQPKKRAEYIIIPPDWQAIDAYIRKFL